MGAWTALSNGEQLHLCDGNGRTIGIVLSPAMLEQMNTERERLAKEVEELRKQVALLEQDWQSMFRLLPPELQVTEEDMREAMQNSVPFDKLIEEVEQMGIHLTREMP